MFIWYRRRDVYDTPFHGASVAHPLSKKISKAHHTLHVSRPAIASPHHFHTCARWIFVPATGGEQTKKNSEEKKTGKIRMHTVPVPYHEPLLLVE